MECTRTVHEDVRPIAKVLDHDDPATDARELSEHPRTRFGVANFMKREEADDEVRGSVRQWDGVRCRGDAVGILPARSSDRRLGCVTRIIDVADGYRGFGEQL